MRSIGMWRALVAGLLLSLVLVAGTMNARWSMATSSTTVGALAKETHFHGIAVDGANPDRLYLATHHGLYLAGLDGRASQISEVRDYMGFTVNPLDPATLYASGHPAAGGNLGFLVSTDGGHSWTKLSDGVGGPVDFHQLDVSKADPRVIYGVHGGLQRSSDGGRTWEAVAPAPAGIISLAASGMDVDTLYAGTQRGLQRSTDSGRNWTTLLDQPATMVHVTGDGTIYSFLVGRGLVRAAEKNLAWRVVGSPSRGAFILHLAVDPRNSQRLYAVAYDSKTRSQTVVTSSDGGENWDPLGKQ